MKDFPLPCWLTREYWEYCQDIQCLRCTAFLVYQPLVAFMLLAFLDVSGTHSRTTLFPHDPINNALSWETTTQTRTRSCLVVFQGHRQFLGSEFSRTLRTKNNVLRSWAATIKASEWFGKAEPTSILCRSWKGCQIHPLLSEHMEHPKSCDRV
jgi:hypothetical protein